MGEESEDRVTRWWGPGMKWEDGEDGRGGM